MVTVPNEIINKTAKRVQNTFVVGGLMSGLLSYGGFSSGDASFGWKLALAAAALFFIASKIKTKKKLRGGTAIYK